jgi:hypothetical protein
VRSPPQVPGLVKDGCLFSYQQVMAFIAYLRNKSPPDDPALKQALADDDAGATAYEEQKA